MSLLKPGLSGHGSSDLIDSKQHDNGLLEGCIEAIAQGDRSALELFYNKTKSSVYAFSLSILKDKQDAEDVMQDCFITVCHSAHSYKRQGKPMAWLLTITKNLCFGRLRQRKKTVNPEDFETFVESREDLPFEQRILLKECMSSLKDDEHQIVILHTVAGFKHREIATFLDIPLATTLSKYNRAIKKLRDKMTSGE